MTQDIKIEKGIALPPKKGGVCKYPLHDMEVGDSFFATDEKGLGIRTLQAHVCSAVANFKKRHGKRFSVRIGDGGVRVWRVE